MNVLIGITGGIAAYKSCVLLRAFQKAGHDVKALMTHHAQEFVTPKTFEGLTQDQVYTPNWFASTQGNAHIELARWADVFVIAPATAHSLFACAHGKAEDLLTTVYLAFEGPVFFAPAMNTKMLEQPATQENIQKLISKGDVILDPASGELACKEVGPGKMMEPEDIARIIMEKRMHASSLSGKKVVITAGPTREYLDPVRFLSSPATGTLGVHMASVLLGLGADVTLIHGPIENTFEGQSTQVTSAQDMLHAVKEHTPCDVFIATAAVSDYRPLHPSDTKLKKTDDNLVLELTRNPDILQYVCDENRAGITVGFAAESHNLLANAEHKRMKKQVDIMVANEVHRTEKGFGDLTNTFHVMDRADTFVYENIDKPSFAKNLISHIEQVYEDRI